MYLTLEQLEDLPHPNIARALFIISIDNGGINRDRSVELWSEEFKEFVVSVERDFDLASIDKWLGVWPNDDLDLICTGEESESKIMLDGSPNGTDELLNLWFEVVC